MAAHRTSLAGAVRSYCLILQIGIPYRSSALAEKARAAIQNWQHLGALFIVLSLTACTPKQQTVITTPKVVETERLVVEPIPEKLLRTHPIAEGSLAECPKVAALRRVELEACIADKRAIESMQQKGSE